MDIYNLQKNGVVASTKASMVLPGMCYQNYRT